MSLFSHDLCLRARARNLADQLRLRAGTDRADLLMLMLRENAGCLMEPNPADDSAPHRFELHLLGIFATGDTLNQAIAEWIAAARRCAPEPGACPDDRQVA